MVETKIKVEYMNIRLHFFWFFLIAILVNTTSAQGIAKSVLVKVDQPVKVNYTASAGDLKKLSLDVSIVEDYATLSIYADDTVLVDNIDIEKSGNHTLNTIGVFDSIGNVTLQFVALGSDVTINSLAITEINDLNFPIFKDISTEANIIDGPSLKYAGPSIADIDNDGDYDLVLNNHNDVPSKLFWNNGDGTFAKNDKNLSLWKLMDLHGSAAGDYDNDGDLDIIMALGGGNGTNPTPPIFFKNDKGTLIRSEKEVGIVSGARGRSPRWSDLDLDGDLDLILINAAGINGNDGAQHIFYENKGDGNFQTKNISGVENAKAERILITDINNDHIDDFVLFEPVSFWLGNGDFSFKEVTDQWLPDQHIEKVTSVVDIDIDNDGDLDLYLARGQGYFSIAENNAIDFFPIKKHLDARVSGSKGKLPFDFTAEKTITLSRLDVAKRNKYEDGFPIFLGESKIANTLPVKEDSLIISQEIAKGWPTARTENGIYIGYIGNGKWKAESVRNADIYWSIHFSLDGISSFTPIGWTPNNRNFQDILLRNDNTKFTSVGPDWNIPIAGNSWGATVGDFNNDSFQDLYVYRFGFLKSRVADWLLLNTGSGSFEITTAHTAHNRGATNHGDMGQAFDFDFDGNVDLLNGDDEFGTWHLYKNESKTDSNYALIQVGYAPKSNSDPISAEVTLVTEKNTYHRRVGSAGEAHSQSLLNTVHFGLGSEDQIKSVTVRWRNGETVILNDLKTNTLIKTQ